MLFVSWRVSALKPTAAAYEHICKWIIKSIKYWHDERNLNLGKLVYSIHTFIFSDIFAWFWFHYKNVCSCLLLYQKPLYVVYYSTRNHYMLFITLPETTICCLLLYQKTLYVVYYSTRNHTICCLLLYQKPHYMLFITLPENTICCLLLYQKTLYVVYCFCLRFLCFVFVSWLSSFGYHFNHVHPWFHFYTTEG